MKLLATADRSTYVVLLIIVLMKLLSTADNCIDEVAVNY